MQALIDGYTLNYVKSEVSIAFEQFNVFVTVIANHARTVNAIAGMDVRTKQNDFNVSNLFDHGNIECAVLHKIQANSVADLKFIDINVLGKVVFVHGNKVTGLGNILNRVFTSISIYVWRPVFNDIDWNNSIFLA